MGTVRSELRPELVAAEGEGPTDAQKAQVLREAVSYYIRYIHRAPDVRAICEEFIAAVDEKAREAIGSGGGPEPLPDVPGVSIDPTSATVPASGGFGTIAVAITSPGESGTWTVDKDAVADWLSYSPATPQSADGTVNWTAASNASGEPRQAHFYINGKTFTLDQEAA